MKKTILFLIIILIGGSIAFAQIAKTKRKQAGKTKSVKTVKPQAANKKTALDREKFNPLANPNDDLQTAIARAQKENKRIILDVGGEWCGWCRKMDYYFLENKALAKMRDENFVWLKVNFSPENENKEFLTKFPAITGYPHLFVLEKDGSLLHSQNTSLLEEPNLPVIMKPESSVREATENKAKEKSYDLYNFVEFLSLWSAH